MNACTFCKKGKRKCDKTRPACSNCLRLRRACAYSEDTIQTNFAPEAQSSILPLKHQNLPYPSLSLGIDPFNHETLHRATLGITMQILGSIENMEAVSNDFFTGTHQRIPALSKFRFYGQLHILPIAPRAGFAALCLCILLIQQMPTGRNMSTIQSPLYVTVKNLINLLEMSNDSSLDLLHSRILVAFYEMGHGLHAAAYVSVAVCARTARALGLHRKMWRNVEAAHDLLSLEEEKRVWWAIVCMDRFMGLFNGDSLIVSEDPERTDPLPIEDLLWSEAIVPADIEASIAAPPSLETPLTTTVGQMARECQIAHLVGRAVRHIFNPTADVEFNADEAVQLERTMKAYLPLLAEEELKIGKYCGAFGMCNSALFLLYETTLNRSSELTVDQRHHILNSMEETSLRAIFFSEATYAKREENYPPDIYSPYLLYSLFQSGVVQYRLWKQSNNLIHKRHLDSMKSILHEFTNRWIDAWRYINILENLSGTWPPVIAPFQGYLNGTEQLGR